MRILLTSNKSLWCDGLRPFLYKVAPTVRIFEATTFDQASQVAESAGGVELALFGQSLQSMKYFSDLCDFKENFPNAKIVILVLQENIEFFNSALRCGVNGFITPDLSGSAMVSALRLIVQRDFYLLPKPAFSLVADEHYAPQKAAIAPPWTKLRLSKSELEVAPLLIEGHSNKTISRLLGIEEGAVKARLRSLFHKLGASNRAQAAVLLSKK